MAVIVSHDADTLLRRNGLRLARGWRRPDWRRLRRGPREVSGCSFLTRKPPPCLFDDWPGFSDRRCLLARGRLGVGFLAFCLGFPCNLLSLCHYSLPNP